MCARVGLPSDEDRWLDADEGGGTNSNYTQNGWWALCLKDKWLNALVIREWVEKD
jgi:hypothetical protein